MRKLWFFSAAFVILSALVAIGAIADVVYESVAIATLIGFGGGNVGEHFARRPVQPVLR